MNNFAELQQWFDSLPDQQDGRAQYLCETGEPYVEFFAGNLARPGDEAVIERAVADQMFWQINRYFDNRKGRVYWRKRLETVIEKRDVVLRYDDNGPDTDFMTDRKCIKDSNWMRVACYCRLYREKD